MPRERQAAAQHNATHDDARDHGHGWDAALDGAPPGRLQHGSIPPVLGVITAAGLVLVSASVSGCALWRACGLRAAPSAAPAAGLAIVLFLAAIGIRLPGRAKMAAALVGLALLVAVVALWRMKGGPRLGMPLWAWITAAAVLAIALIPFGASGRAGILGVGTNDDMTEHLLAAWAMQGPHADVLSKLVHSGYPIAPHALVAAIASVTGISLEHTFMGMLVAVPALLALAAAGLISVLCERLGEPFPPPRPLALALAGALAGVCYLQSAFLAQASFKEPLESVFVLAFAAALLSGRDVTGWTARRHTHVIGIPAAVLASGSVYVYSYPGLAWIGGTLVIWTAVLIASRQWRAPRDWRVPAVAIVVFGRPDRSRDPAADRVRRVRIQPRDGACLRQPAAGSAAP